MEISLRFIGSTIVEMTYKDSGTIVTSDIADINGDVSVDIIESLESIVQELKDHNKGRADNLQAKKTETTN